MRECLALTGGHSFDRPAFEALLGQIPGTVWRFGKQPEALIEASASEAPGLILFYDIPGIRFRKGAPPEILSPPADLKRAFAALLQRGQPLLFLHHAVAGWPSWDEYAEAAGARFFYQPGSYKGRGLADSGYARDVAYRAAPVGPHAITRGLEAGFELTDELYLAPLLEPDILPLMRAETGFESRAFFSAARALAGETDLRFQEPQPRGNDLIAWAKRAGRSPAVTILAGDGPGAYRNPGFHKLLGNAVHWLLTGEARAFGQGEAA